MMKSKRLLIILSALLALTAMQSCKSYKNVPYFKNVSDSAYMYRNGIEVAAQPYKDIQIQPDDILQVTVLTLDAATTGTGTNGQMDMIQDPLSSSNPLANNANRNIAGYLVDKEGNIELPIAGKVKVGGLSTSDAKEAIRLKVLQFYKEPVVNVRLANFKVTVLGEVLKPGSYLVASEKATILDALGLAGDMTIYGKRENVMLVRRDGDKQKMIRFNLNSTDLIQSPYYYLRQGDVVYVEPGKGKAAATDASMVRTYGIIASTLSLLVIIATRVNF
ncbi:polysaccharide biosynthesis/export family protein [Taibaiella chishuiensis]|uniref:Polysaccharide export outer membrane protein n=1 Tax=Taibaiella chishuiensis TaxID=1434707 RepID=A0A2P8D2M4_9BACT|nr:polysaccharide biosynthesis/export family protein [Taibaiella chishuiensis]PSK91461.1 polysaccharide export outer membrane protein [Taibaiella chishuiensis]